MSDTMKYRVERTLNHDGELYGPSHKKRFVEMTAEQADQADALVRRGILVQEITVPPPPPEEPEPEPAPERSPETNTTTAKDSVKKRGKGKK